MASGPIRMWRASRRHWRARPRTKRMRTRTSLRRRRRWPSPLGRFGPIELFRRIHPFMEFGPVVSLVSASTALVASIVGPIVTLTVARRQYNATVISASRQKWIETLRDTLAELIALLSGALVVKSKWKDKWDRGRGPLDVEPAMLEKFEHIVLSQSKIHLLLNPTDADHQLLHETIA